MKNIVVFASGSGTNFQAVVDAVEQGVIDARLAGLIVNRSGIGAVRRAEQNHIPYVILIPSEFESDEEYAKVLLKQLERWDASLIILAGYLLKIPGPVIRQYDRKIINIHPSLLPKYGGKGFFGMNVHRAVIENGDRESGCTVHFVTEHYDEGPVIAQRKVPVLESDTPETLANRVLEQEHRLLVEVAAAYIHSNSTLHSKNKN